MVINRAATGLVLAKPGLLDSCEGGGDCRVRRAPEQGLKAFSGRNCGVATDGGGWAGGGGPQPRTDPHLGARCGRALGIRSGRESGRALSASLPRPASSPYHVAPPHVEEVSVHHSAVTTSLLGHAKQRRVLHRAGSGPSRWARCSPCPPSGPAPPRTNGTRLGSRLVGRRDQ